MELGIIGLGKMGKYMALRLVQQGVRVVAWNRSQDKVQEVVQAGGVGANDVNHLVEQLGNRKVVWIMLPYAIVDEYIEQLKGMLRPGDIIVDGGNSNFHDSVRRYNTLKESGIHFVDVGVSGGLAAKDSGYCTMAGGDREAYDVVAPILEKLCVPGGYGYMGPAGSGHYVKMVHNAVEYGMMQAIGEGFELLDKGAYPDTDLAEAARVWTNGSIVRGFLMDLAYNALEASKNDGAFLQHYAAEVNDSGEGRWAAHEAIEHAVPFVVNTYATHARFMSRDKDSLAMKMLSALREGFGGHPVKKE